MNPSSAAVTFQSLLSATNSFLAHSTIGWLAAGRHAELDNFPTDCEQSITIKMYTRLWLQQDKEKARGSGGSYISVAVGDASGTSVKRGSDWPLGTIKLVQFPLTYCSLCGLLANSRPLAHSASQAVF